MYDIRHFNGLNGILIRLIAKDAKSRRDGNNKHNLKNPEMIMKIVIPKRIKSMEILRGFSWWVAIRAP